MDLLLKDKTALVTGSTAGIGLEIARRLALEGANVVVTGRNQVKLDEAVASIVRSLAPTQGSAAPSVRGVLADAASAEGAKTLTLSTDQVDILINNLGIYESKAFADISDADWHAYFDTNLLSGVRLSRTYFPKMLKQNWGRIIFISSESALTIPTDMIHYATTKTAQLSLSRGLANLTKGTQVTVNSVLPGPTRSEGIVGFMRSVVSNPSAPAEQIEAEFFASHRPTSLIQRLSEAEEIASLVAYLSSPLAGSINGAALRSEGGLVQTLA
jgi:NAD(P)-dependent dehydrogenase (short-subunit alcohol dehydrogenase family)